MAAVLRPFFKIYDLNGDGCMDETELKPLLRDLGHIVSKENFDELVLVRNG
jgi:Ca2+-binding EF-hand superfamily protein